MARVRKEESGKSKGCHDWDSDLSIWQKVNGLNGLNGLLTEGLAVLHYTQCCTSRSFMSSVKRGNVDPNMLAGPES